MQFFPNIQDQIFENGEVRRGAKNRHIAKKSTSRMRAPLGMIPMQYKKNQFKTVGEDRF